MTLILDINSVIESANTLDQAGQSRQASIVYISFIEDCIQANNLTAIADLISNVNVATAGVHSIVAIFRFTHRVSDSIPNWRDCYYAARQNLFDRGLDAGHLFVGLPR